MKLLGTILADALSELAVEVRAAADLSAGPGRGADATAGGIQSRPLTQRREEASAAMGIKVAGAEAPTELPVRREEGPVHDLATDRITGIRLVSSQTHKRMPSRRYGAASPGDGIHLSVVAGRDHDSSRSLDVRRGVK